MKINDKRFFAAYQQELFITADMYWQKARSLHKFPRLVDEFGMPDIELAFLGTANHYQMGQVDYESSATFGRYQPAKHRIQINADWLGRVPDEYIFHAVLPHELAHAFTRVVVARRLSDIDDPHGRHWYRVARRYFGITQPEAHLVSWKELSTFFADAKNWREPVIPPQEPNKIYYKFAIEVDETTERAKRAFLQMVDDYGDLWTKHRNFLVHRPTFTKIEM